MIEIRKTDHFAKWLNGLKDLRARAKILIKLERLGVGNPGDVKPVGSGISELRINYGPGYRIYYKKYENKIVILLAGGNKSTQKKDIKIAIELASNL
jgi:putative addiction module killer protein